MYVNIHPIWCFCDFVWGQNHRVVMFLFLGRREGHISDVFRLGPHRDVRCEKLHGFEITNIGQQAGACLTGCHGSLCFSMKCLPYPFMELRNRALGFVFLHSQKLTNITWKFQLLLQMIHFLLSYGPVFGVDIRSFSVGGGGNIFHQTFQVPKMEESSPI